jgi:peptide chain release factor subunit 1
LAGSADFKNDLAQSDMFDARLSEKVIKIVDVSYGGDNGFNQAIELASDAYVFFLFCLIYITKKDDAIFRLSNVKFVQEKALISRFFDEVAQDTGKYVYGVEESLKALEMGAVELLIVCESLDVRRYENKNIHWKKH